MANVGLQQPMRTLFPPLHVEKDGNVPHAGSGEEDVLSKEIKENFIAIRSALGTSPTNNNTNKFGGSASSSSSDESLPSSRASTVETSSSRKRKSPPSLPSMDTAEQIAVRTAVAVENEMSRLKSGIAELEALLAATSESDNEFVGLEGVSFPSLPPVVPDEIHDDEEESSADDHDGDHKSGVCG
mmetsp:Transcript_24720/g.34547  ORF Transcript_24720/g.34547 Transcript_24720/m.34547 type:complete len:185 (+) Transcript_24720:536-1090(+)